MIVKKFVTSSLSNNNYVVIDEGSREAILIDCSGKIDDILAYIEQQGANLKYILLTHGHFDHILGLNQLSNALVQKAYVHKDDKFLLDNINDFMDFIHFHHVVAPKINHFLDENTDLSLGKDPIQIISTPGHTPGCVCFLIQNYLFSGDTMFYQNHGRTDLPQSDEKKMQDSLQKLLINLPEDTNVLPGHGPQTTIRDERIFYGTIKK